MKFVIFTLLATAVYALAALPEARYVWDRTGTCFEIDASTHIRKADPTHDGRCAGKSAWRMNEHKQCALYDSSGKFFELEPVKAICE